MMRISKVQLVLIFVFFCFVMISEVLAFNCPTKLELKDNLKIAYTDYFTDNYDLFGSKSLTKSVLKQLYTAYFLDQYSDGTGCSSYSTSLMNNFDKIKEKNNIGEEETGFEEIIVLPVKKR